MAKLLAIIGLGLILSSTAAASTPAPRPDTKNQAREQKYCLTFNSDTGSHIARTECRTKKEWKQLGIDVDALSEKSRHSEGLA
jgi:hypothetical protein